MTSDRNSSAGRGPWAWVRSGSASTAIVASVRQSSWRRRRDTGNRGRAVRPASRLLSAGGDRVAHPCPRYARPDEDVVGEFLVRQDLAVNRSGLIEVESCTG